jgi:hypothetical protein
MLPALFTVHAVTVETQSGEGGLGDVYSAPVSVAGFLDYTRQLVRTLSGDELVSLASFYTNLDRASLFALDSRVTLPDGTIAYVLQAARRDDGGLTGLSHLEVSLR